MNGTGDDDTAAAYPDELLGNLIALSASFGTALYLAISQYLRSKVDLYIHVVNILHSFFLRTGFYARGKRTVRVLSSSRLWLVWLDECNS